MRKVLLFVPVIAVAVVLSGCTSIELKDTDADMPLALVEKYRAAKEPYADHGLFWIPGVFMDAGRVWRTADGFGANNVFAMGPLATLIASGGSTKFDNEGRLVERTSSSDILWGFLFHEGVDYSVAGNEEDRGFRILYGLLGYDKYHHGPEYRKTGYFLYIPIVTSRSCPSALTDGSSLAPREGEGR